MDLNNLIKILLFFLFCRTLKKLTDDLIDSSKQRDAKQDEAVNACKYQASKNKSHLLKCF